MTKVTAVVYGLMSIGMAFFAGLIGSVLKAAISLAGALMGPLFGTYLLGILCPYATEIVSLTINWIIQMTNSFFIQQFREFSPV